MGHVDHLPGVSEDVSGRIRGDEVIIKIAKVVQAVHALDRNGQPRLRVGIPRSASPAPC